MTMFIYTMLSLPNPDFIINYLSQIKVVKVKKKILFASENIS